MGVDFLDFFFLLQDIRGLAARLKMKRDYKKQSAEVLPGRRPDVHQARGPTVVG